MRSHRGMVEGFSRFRRILLKFFFPREEEKKGKAVDMGSLQDNIWQALMCCQVFEGKVISNSMELRAWGEISPDYKHPGGLSEWEIRLVATSCGEKVVCTILKGTPQGVVSLCKAVCPTEIVQIFTSLFLHLSESRLEE